MAHTSSINNMKGLSMKVCLSLFIVSGILPMLGRLQDAKKDMIKPPKKRERCYPGTVTSLSFFFSLLDALSKLSSTS